MSKPLWVDYALSYLGIAEDSPNGNRLIKGWFKEVNLDADGRTSWCAAFISHVLLKFNLIKNGSARSLDFLNNSMLRVINSPKDYCIVIFNRGQGKGHIGICLGSVGDKLVILGGNQSNKVSIIAYSKAKIAGFRATDGTSNELTEYKGSYGTVAVKDEESSWVFNVKSTGVSI